MTNWIIVGGIFLITAVSFLLYWLSRIGNPPVDQSGIKMPLSGWTSSSVVEAYTRSERSLKHAHDQHHLLEGVVGWFLEQLKKVKLPFVDPERKGTVAVMLILTFMVICIISIACIASGFGGKVSNVFSSSPTAITASGAMPMNASFQVTPNTTFYLDDVAPVFDLQLGQQQERYDCQRGELLKFRVETQGTLLIDNFTKVNIIVETPTIFPGVVSVTCPKAGRIGFSQSANIPAPVLAAPTTAPTQQAQEGQTQESYTVEDEPQKAPMVVVPVPAPSSGKYFSVLICNEIDCGKYSSWGSIQPGSESYYSLIQTTPCGQPFTIPAEYTGYLVYALVDVNVDMYGPEIKSDGKNVSIACEGSILLVIDPPDTDQ